MRRVVVVGAGPIGLHAALQAVLHGYDVRVIERGAVGAAIRRWSHVRLFTPFAMNSTETGRRIVAETGRLPDADSLLTGDEYLQEYLLPLGRSEALRQRIQTSTRLIAASRHHCGKSNLIGQPARAEAPFRLLIENSEGAEDTLEADLLLDCTGFTARHRFVGTGGIPCPGERSCLSATDYEIADPSPAASPADHVAVIGSGYSAATSVCLLEQQGYRISWLTRGNRDVPLLPVAEDSLAERRRLTEQANRLARQPGSAVEWMAGAEVESLGRSASGFSLQLSFEDGRQQRLECSRIVANPGFRPDPRPYEELQIHRCYATDGPIKLAAHLLGDTSADCLSQTAPGPELLKNPEPGMFILGAASYGRTSRFLLKNGLEQLEQLFESVLAPEEAAT